MKYIFYDTETTGLDPAYDQILQFAALEVDENLNEMSSIDIRCRILPYIVPSPGALLVTRVSPKDLLSPNHSYLEMIYEIREWMSQKCPCMFVGHNSIKFDETFLRHAFYRTLHPLYLTNTNGNLRGDTMKIAQAVAIFSPETINIPLSEKGKPTFRLGDLVRANGYDLKEEDAHDALADVRATLGLARLLQQRSPEIWSQMIGNATKKTSLTFMRSNPIFCSAEVNFGRAEVYIVTAISANPKYDSEMAVFDLSYDPSEYLNLSADELVSVMMGKKKAIRIIAANSQPIMVTTEVGHKVIEQKAIDPEILKHRYEKIQNSTGFKQRVAEAISMRYPDAQELVHIESMIYQGFPSKNDELMMDKFHKSEIGERITLCSGFENNRYTEIASRILYTEHYEHMDEMERNRIHAQFSERLLTEEEVPWLTIPKALEAIAELANAENQEFLNEITVFIEEMRKRYATL